MTRRFTRILAALALLVGLTIPMGVWGQVVSGTTYSTTAPSSLPQGWSGQQHTANNASYFSLTYSTDYIQTTNFAQLGFTSITLKARMYGGPSDAEKVISVSWYNSDTKTETVLGTISPTNKSLNDYTIESPASVTEGEGYVKIQCKEAASNKGCGVSEVTLTFEGGTTPTTYTVTYNANGGTGTMTDSNSPYIADATVTLLTNTFTAPSGYEWSSWEVKDASNNAIAVNNNQFTMPASNVTVSAQWTETTTPGGDEQWILTNLADLTTSDVFVIVGNGYAMTNNNGTSSAPEALAVTIENDMITSNVAANIQWTVSGNADNGYTFYPNGSTTSWLYCNTTNATGSNNNLRVGTGNRKLFVLTTKSNKDYIVTNDSNSDRYVCVYNNSDWRGYVESSIVSTNTAFYKKVTGGVVPPTITAANVDIAYDATSGSITYTINNEPTPVGTLTVGVTDGSWLTLGQGTTSPIAFTCTANENTTERTATVTLTYTYGDNETISKDVTVTQAAAPVIYTTIPAIFDAATSTSTDVNVTFGNWVVSGVSGSNAFVTDNNGNGFIIYTDNHGFVVNDKLIGTVMGTPLKLYSGSAEFTNLTKTTEGLSVSNDGTITVITDKTIADLNGVNTGAVITLNNLTYDGTNLTDGTNTIKPYTTLYDGTFVNGKTYNVTGVYQQYNNTKEILPRSAADIVEVEVQHEEYTLTVSNLSHVNLFIFGGEESETIISTEDGETTAQVYDGTEVLVSIDVEAGYVFQSLTITDGNGAPVETEELTANEYYSFLMPISNVTITATAVEPPLEATFIFNTDEGLQVLGITKPASGNGTDLVENQYYTLDGVTMTCTHGSTNTRVWNSDGSTDLRVYKNGSLTFTAPTNYVITSITFTGNTKFDDWSGAENSHTFSATGTMKISTVTVTYAQILTTKEIEANQWYLISSPVGTIDPGTISDMMPANGYALYRFDQSGDADGKEWINYKGSAFNLEAGKGYLYASQNGCTLSFTGTPYSGDGQVTLATYDADADLPGYNLVGNPFPTNAYLDDSERPFYVMSYDNVTTGEVVAATAGSAIAPMQGIFVVAANEDDNSVTFTTTAPSKSGSQVALNVTKNRGAVIDRAIVSMGEGRQLPKFQLFEGSTKVYIPQGDQDYAVVRSEGQGELPVNFRASENGTYTLSMDVENMDMNYLHLVDNMTGMDVDLLQTPSYTFEAKVNDYESRFRLVFAANNEDGVSTGSTTFAFYSNGSWIINNAGEATLQVVDLTGRILSSETVNGSVSKTINAVPGVYMLRLINGDNVNVQKIVVR